MRAWGRLFRLSLAPSAAADVVAGLLLAHGGRWPSGLKPWFLVLASLCVYHGGLVWNDWADRARDAQVRAGRPLPSGAISPSAAFAAGLALFVLAPVLAWQVNHFAAAWVCGLAVLAAAYDFGPRGPWLGPVLLALCRAGNLGFGRFSLLAAEFRWIDPVVALAPCLLYGLYVFRVSRLGRLEDGEDRAPLGVRPTMLLTAAASLLALAPFIPPLSPWYWPARGIALAIAISGAWGLVRASRSTRMWTPPLVERAMGLCLRRLLLFSATFAAVSFDGAHPDALIATGAILCGYPLSFALRKLFPPS